MAFANVAVPETMSDEVPVLLVMAGRHINNKTLELSIGNLLKFFSHNSVVSTQYKPRPHLFYKRHKRLFSGLPNDRVLIVLSHSK